jgi:hypothetical protein
MKGSFYQSAMQIAGGQLKMAVPILIGTAR